MPVWLQLIISIGSFFGFSGIILLFIKRWLDRHDKKDDERNEARVQYNYLTLKGVSASISLSEQTATCVKNDRVNGEMEKAREYAAKTKNEIRDFMDKQGIKNFI
jgi:hypothetical protein